MKKVVWILIALICYFVQSVSSSKRTFVANPTKATIRKATTIDGISLSSTINIDDLLSSNKIYESKEKSSKSIYGKKKKSKKRSLSKKIPLSTLDSQNHRGVERGGGDSSFATNSTPSMYWAVFHNWLYFLSLGFNLINVPFMIRLIVDGKESSSPSSESIALSGKVESVDKFLTFLGVGFLSSLSDKYGRRPLMAWSAIGFMITNIIQASVATKEGNSVALLYLADFIDGISSCMLPLCQAYVTDCSSNKNLATNLGIFQGLSAAGAFIFAFPVGGLIGAKKGPKTALLIAAALQGINAAIILLFTPESNFRRAKEISLREANPIGGLVRLFGRSSLLRIVSAIYLLASLARSSLDAQFVNYTNIRFGWTQAQSGPVLVLVGLMLAIAPRLIVPRIGLVNAILSGLIVFATGLAAAGLCSTPLGFIFSIGIVAVGCVCLPALQALLATLALPNERGALLGAVGSLNELTASIGSTLYAVLLAKFTSENSAIKVPGMHFVIASLMVIISWCIAYPGFLAHKDHSALTNDNDWHKNVSSM